MLRYIIKYIAHIPILLCSQHCGMRVVGKINSYLETIIQNQKVKMKFETIAQVGKLKHKFKTIGYSL